MTAVMDSYEYDQDSAMQVPGCDLDDAEMINEKMGEHEGAGDIASHTSSSGLLTLGKPLGLDEQDMEVNRAASEPGSQLGMVIEVVICMPPICSGWRQQIYIFYGRKGRGVFQ